MTSIISFPNCGDVWWINISVAVTVFYFKPFSFIDAELLVRNLVLQQKSFHIIY
jgi:hypothetical protein